MADRFFRRQPRAGGRLGQVIAPRQPDPAGGGAPAGPRTGRPRHGDFRARKLRAPCQGPPVGHADPAGLSPATAGLPARGQPHGAAPLFSGKPSPRSALRRMRIGRTVDRAGAHRDPRDRTGPAVPGRDSPPRRADRQLRCLQTPCSRRPRRHPGGRLADPRGDAADRGRPCRATAGAARGCTASCGHLRDGGRHQAVRAPGKGDRPHRPSPAGDALDRRLVGGPAVPPSGPLVAAVCRGARLTDRRATRVPDARCGRGGAASGADAR